MNQVNCPVCGNKCIKAGKTKAGSQRWLCRKCNSSVTHKIDNSAKELQIFLDWLFGKESQSSMPGDGRTFRRKTAKYWNIWPMPPKVEDSRDVLYLDGIYLGRKACILICCDDKYVLGWYLCRYEYAAAWTALMKRIAEPRMVVSDGGTGFAKALKKVWPGAKHQRCVFHVFCQVRRYTTSRPNSMAGKELYNMAKELLKINTKEEADLWINQRIIAGNAQFTGIAAGRGVGFTTGLLLLRKGLGMRETPIRPHSWHCRMQSGYQYGGNRKRPPVWRRHRGSLRPRGRNLGGVEGMTGGCGSGCDPAIHTRRLRVYHRPRRLRMASRISIFFAARRFEPLNSMG